MYFFVTESSEIAELVAKANEKAEQRRQNAEQLREAIKRSLRFSIPWTVNVLENFTEYMRRITKHGIPRIQLGVEDVILADALVKGK